MCLKEAVKRMLYPCQEKIDALMRDHDEACKKLDTVVKENLTTAFPQFQHVIGRRHVNPR